MIERIVKAISFEPFSAASNGFMPAFDVAGDVFQHYDAVVDDEADRQRDREQRNVVDGVAEHVHEGAGADQRDRQRQRRNQRRCRRLQEHENDDDDERRPTAAA